MNYMNDLKLNERIIKIVGSANIDKDIQLGHDYTLGLNVNCFRAEDANNEDGSFDKIYKLKLLGHVVVTNDAGVNTVAKVKGSKSEKLRWVIMSAGLDYDSEMDKLIEKYK